MRYDRTKHAARRTDDYVFGQLIPYIGNKRKLLWLIDAAIRRTGLGGELVGRTFVDAFSGSTVVSRFAKKRGLRVIANDWEPYAESLASAAVACNAPPAFARLGGYDAAIRTLNALPPRIDWVTTHLCPDDDDSYDTAVERMFFMRRNGMRIDAIRCRIDEWERDGVIDHVEKHCLLAPLLYQVCYTSNTSGVFKGFHEGWGGSNGTARYRICGDLLLRPITFFDNGERNLVFRRDATDLLCELRDLPQDSIIYLDPPYNQHPYGSNYHVLNTVTLWDQPSLSPKIEGRNKAAIRTDWRRERRSDYNYRATAAAALEQLLDAAAAVGSRHILISYSTDGLIPIETLLELCVTRGRVEVVTAPYKRYRVSPTRPSRKPRNIEFILVLDTRARSPRSAADLADELRAAEAEALATRAEASSS